MGGVTLDVYNSYDKSPKIVMYKYFEVHNEPLRLSRIQTRLKLICNVVLSNYGVDRNVLLDIQSLLPLQDILSSFTNSKTHLFR